MRYWFRRRAALAKNSDAKPIASAPFVGPDAVEDVTDRRIPTDNPIRKPSEDSLRRTRVAEHFVRQVLSLDSREGLVVGVLGPWGSGKTSFINLARSSLEGAGSPILEFNPWMFSGAEHVIESFFVKLAAQLKVRSLASIASRVEEYGEAFSGLGWLPIVGPWVERGRGATKILATLLNRRKEGVGERRQKLETALGVLRHPIVVVLDDIDRLSTAEIRDVFKLVRLTASFPNIIYVLAFDRGRVETALAEQGLSGRDYLEKILQVAIDLPVISPHILQREILIQIDEALKGIDNPGPFDQGIWPDIFVEILRPLLHNIRDVKRYAAAVHGTVVALEGKIALTDVLALEGVRTFLPDVFGQFESAIDALTTTSSIGYGPQRDPPHLKAAIDRLLEAAPKHREVVISMIRRLFPAADRHMGGMNYLADFKTRWLRDRRVAHEEILRLYLERVVGEKLQSFDDATRAWKMIANRTAFDEYMRSLEPGHLEDVIGALETFEDEFSPDQVIPGTVVLLNLLPIIPERQHGMFEFDTRMVVGRVTYRLLRSLKDASAIEDAVRQILPLLNSLSAKLEVITDVGYREGAGHRLVSEQAATGFEKDWRAEVRSASIGDLIEETDLIRVLFRAKKDAEAGEQELAIPVAPELTLAIVLAARSEVKSQTVDSRAVRRSPRLHWDVLVELFDGEEALKRRILEIPRSDENADVFKLVEKYLAGWRPTEL
jgi:predicted KAP-like P-loop ATPase